MCIRCMVGITFESAVQALEFHSNKKSHAAVMMVDFPDDSFAIFGNTDLSPADQILMTASLLVRMTETHKMSVEEASIQARKDIEEAMKKAGKPDSSAQFN